MPSVSEGAAKAAATSINTHLLILGKEERIEQSIISFFPAHTTL